LYEKQAIVKHDKVGAEMICLAHPTGWPAFAPLDQLYVVGLEVPRAVVEEGDGT
jgi:hypothetical protein